MRYTHTAIHVPVLSSHHFYLSGYKIQEHNNPPDFFLDVISGDFNIDVDTVDPEKTSTGIPCIMLKPTIRHDTSFTHYLECSAQYSQKFCQYSLLQIYGNSGIWVCIVHI